ncbi:phage integrase-related [Holotrichia oblita]|uniref:Phage integrase-related n=1 Tax=Holotrichia oblita TaxID=644536 RepID=A0ACB9TDW4_HOLOL|nr:phage integrase-related [Holotrichia oblita]
MPKKAAVFEEHHIRQIITDAPYEVFLPIKAILIIGIAEACRTVELCNMKVADVDLREDIIVINIPHTKNKSCRKFVIVEPMWIDVVTRYWMIRPSPDIPRLFIGFRSEKPTRQNMGHNTISTSAIKIATYLKLPDANNYTGHSFRRTSATILADNGGDILSLKRYGGWKSSSVAEGYVEESITDKKRITSMVQGTTVNYEPDLPPSTSIFEVTPSTSTSVSKSNTELNIPVENFTSNTVDKSVPDKSVPDKSVPDKSVPDKSVPDKSVPDKSVPYKSVPDKAEPDKSVPDKKADKYPIAEGDINAGKKRIRYVSDPIGDQDCATKKYSDTKLACLQNNFLKQVEALDTKLENLKTYFQNEFNDLKAIVYNVPIETSFEIKVIEEKINDRLDKEFMSMRDSIQNWSGLKAVVSAPNVIVQNVNPMQEHQGDAVFRKNMSKHI